MRVEKNSSWSAPYRRRHVAICRDMRIEDWIKVRDMRIEDWIKVRDMRIEDWIKVRDMRIEDWIKVRDMRIEDWIKVRDMRIEDWIKVRDMRIEDWIKVRDMRIEDWIKVRDMRIEDWIKVSNISTLREGPQNPKPILFLDVLWGQQTLPCLSSLLLPTDLVRLLRIMRSMCHILLFSDSVCNYYLLISSSPPINNHAMLSGNNRH